MRGFLRLVKNVRIKYNNYVELGSEFQQEKDITLVYPDDKLSMTKDTFVGKKRQYPDLGFVALYGRRSAEWWNDSDLGIAIIEDHVVIEKANVLEQMGLFLIAVEITDLGTQDVLICQMILPKYGLSLSSNKIQVLESDEFGKNSEEKYFGAADSWKIKGHDRELPFFAPANSKFLSQLQFSFHTDLPPTQSSAQA